MTDMHPEDIKAEIRKHGKTLTAIALKLGITKQVVAVCLYKPNARSEAAIAKVIGRHPSRIWPSRYHADGRRLLPQPTANYRAQYRFSKRSR